MKKIVVCFATLVFSLCYAGTEKNTCQIVNLKGSVVYDGNCQNIGDNVKKNKSPSKWFFLAEKCQVKNYTED